MGRMKYRSKILLFSMGGTLLWVGAEWIWRGFGMPQYPALVFLIGVLPNFGCVWTAAGLFVILWPKPPGRVLSKRAVSKFLYALFLCIFLSEALHALFFGAAFDIWDILASLLAALLLLLFTHGADKETS